MFVHAHPLAVASRFELHLAADHGVQGVVVAHAHAGAGVELGAALANDDAASLDDFARIALHAEALGIAIATVLG